MAVPAFRVVINREQFRALVARGEVTVIDGPDTFVLTLDLDAAPPFRKYTDPPAAREFLPTQHQRRPRS